MTSVKKLPKGWGLFLILPLLAVPAFVMPDVPQAEATAAQPRWDVRDVTDRGALDDLLLDGWEPIGAYSENWRYSPNGQHMTGYYTTRSHYVLRRRRS